MFYVFADTGEQSSWEQYSIGFNSLEEAKGFQLKCSKWDELDGYETCIMEKL